MNSSLAPAGFGYRLAYLKLSDSPRRALDSLEAKLLAGTDNAAWPFWSPDSRSIGFFVPNKLKAVEISGGPAREIADVVVGKGGAWSPDGVILFCPRPIGILYQVSDAGGLPIPVTSLDESRAEIAHGFPQFLPGQVGSLRTH